MKGLRSSELREKSTEDLVEELEKEREAVYNVRRQIIFGQVKDFKAISVHRKNVARIMTLLSQRQREGKE
ncbi:MAG: 50S ribosomal protein L29 [Fimbriimonadia bacterium]|jgi:large subunit ribosomal protein L29